MQKREAVKVTDLVAEPLVVRLHAVAQLARVVAHLHERRPHVREPILHRDIKPANMLRDKTCFFLADFDQAILRPRGDGGTIPTTAHHARGTRGYMDLATPQGLYSDVYSLAVTSYELLAGSVPFDVDAAYKLIPSCDIESNLEEIMAPAVLAHVITSTLFSAPKDRPDAAQFAEVASLAHALEVAHVERLRVEAASKDLDCDGAPPALPEASFTPFLEAMVALQGRADAVRCLALSVLELFSEEVTKIAGADDAARADIVRIRKGATSAASAARKFYSNTLPRCVSVLRLAAELAPSACAQCFDLLVGIAGGQGGLNVGDASSIDLARKVVDEGTLLIVVDVMQRHADIPAVALHGCRVIFHVARSPKIRPFEVALCASAVMQALATHEADESAVVVACAALSRLELSRAHTCGDVPGKIARAMLLHPRNEELARWGSAALDAFASVDGGAFETVCAVRIRAAVAGIDCASDEAQRINASLARFLRVDTPEPPHGERAGDKRKRAGDAGDAGGVAEE